MLKRKIMSDLIAWKENKATKKKALLIKGLRQIGKTYIVKQFAKENYKNVIYINFKENDSIKDVFNGDLVVDRILMDLTAKMPNIKLMPNNTLIIFDEVQECANARASVKYFVEDGRYDVIETGSLLGIRGYNQNIGKGVPTGSEHILYMYPLDFEEFLWAKGIDESVILYLKDCFEKRTPISETTHLAMLRYYKEYICVGGLPEAINTFIATGDMNAVYDEQRDILEAYKDDFGKHLDDNEQEAVDKKLLHRILEVFNSIPYQLAKENKKFQYSKIENHGRSSEYKAAIQWLVDAGIVNKCCALNNFEQPLDGNANPDIFKLYMQDSGLFLAMFEKGIAGHILSGDLGIYKGAIYENIIADAFSKMGRKLYYYSTEGGLEIDFVITYDFETTLIEVKATNGKTKSSNYILSRYNDYKVKKLIKLGEYNIGEIDNKLTIPYYLAFLLK